MCSTWTAFKWTAAALTLGACTVSAPADAGPRAVAVLKYQTDERIILLPVSVRGRSLWFVFDSGARRTVVDPRIARDLNLKTVGSGTTRGTGTGEVPVLLGEPIILRLGSASVRSEEPWLIDLSHVPIDKRVRGLIGSELLSQYIVQIDPRVKQVRLFNPTKFSKAGTTAVPLLVEENRLFVNAVLDVKPGLSVTHKLRVDTGSSDSVNDPIVSQANETRVTTLGNGLGQDYRGVSGRINAVHLGPFTIHDVWAPGGGPPSIGMEILRRFVVTFDAPHGKMYLEPLPSLKARVPPPPTR